MAADLFALDVRQEFDVVLARQRARQIAAQLGFETQDQTRIAVAVSEIARNMVNYAGGGRIEFALDAGPGGQVLRVRLVDQGPGIRRLEQVLSGQERFRRGKGNGLMSARRLMDGFEVHSAPGKGTEVVLTRYIPLQAQPRVSEAARNLPALLEHAEPETALQEVQQQNRELSRLLDDLRERQEELTRVNRELEETNRGVIALSVELEERAEHLRQADQVKSRFLSYLSHEFRGPLGSVLSLADLLLDRSDGALSPEQEKQVKLIESQAALLLEMVGDLLDLGKIEAGKIALHPVWFDVPRLFGALRGMLRPIDTNPDVALIFEETGDLPAMWTDENKIAQILRNLISNALKFTERGEVRVSARLLPERDVVAFQVVDTGIGIAEEDQAVIFEEYSQLQNRLQRHAKGAGLGLPLSRKLAELLGGRLSVRSRPGEGSAFTALVPVVLRKQDDSRPAERREEPEPCERVLIIDDEEPARYVFRSLLGDSRYDVVEAAGGEEGLSAARAGGWTAIFLDVNMPGLNGLQVLAGLKADDATRGIPVFIYTSQPVHDDERQQLLKAGAAGVLSKVGMSRQALVRALAQLPPVPGAARNGLEEDAS